MRDVESERRRVENLSAGSTAEPLPDARARQLDPVARRGLRRDGGCAGNGVVGLRVDRVANETDRAVSQECVQAARVIALSPGGEGEVHFVIPVRRIKRREQRIAPVADKTTTMTCAKLIAPFPRDTGRALGDEDRVARAVADRRVADRREVADRSVDLSDHSATTLHWFPIDGSNG